MKIRDGILLAGGAGTRLANFTSFTSKHLINVNGKPIIDYPIATLKQIGIENLTVILGDKFYGQVVEYLKDGYQHGININYVYQSKPLGIAHGISLCKRFVQDKFIVLLGDNLFINPITFSESEKAQIVLAKHEELKRFGVASLKDKKIVSIIEKPQVIDDMFDNYAITGCYLFNQMFFEYFKTLKPSLRFEFEIAEIIDLYHKDNQLDYVFINGYWGDLGTHESIKKANHILDY